MEGNEDFNMDSHEDLPIYKKAEEIYDVVRQIADLITDDPEDPLSFIKGNMLGDATMICAKIAGAEGGDLYDLRMENAAIIRKAARDLMITNHSLDMLGFEEVQYYDIVRDLIEEFRLLFIGDSTGLKFINHTVFNSAHQVHRY